MGSYPHITPFQNPIIPPLPVLPSRLKDPSLVSPFFECDEPFSFSPPQLQRPFLFLSPPKGPGDTGTYLTNGNPQLGGLAPGSGSGTTPSSGISSTMSMSG